jgi:hypothetical protein
MINKQRIAALEAIAGRVNAPSDVEYRTASDRSMQSVRTRIQAAIDCNELHTTPQETAQNEADSTLIQAYYKAHHIQIDTGARERIERKLENMSRRLRGEL